MSQLFKDRPDRTMLRRALFLMTVCGIVAFIVLAAQLFRLQILRHSELEDAALDQQLRRTVLPAGRGTIDALYFGDADEFHDHYVSVCGEAEWQKALAGTPSNLRMTIAYETEWNVYNGRRTPQIMIRHYK